MKTKIIIYLAILAALVSCSKEDGRNVDLKVSIAPGSIVGVSEDGYPIVKTGDKFEFLLNGEADIITFYSGETGRKYEFRDRTVAQGTGQLNFSIAATRITTANEIDILASADFNGTYDSISIKKATWQTLTPVDEINALKINAAAPGISAAMPDIDLSAYGEGKPVFIAFKLRIQSNAGFVSPQITALKIVNKQSDGGVSTVITNPLEAGCKFVTMSENSEWKALGPGSSYWYYKNGFLGINTAKFNPNNDGKWHEMWAVSMPIYLDKTSPDRPITVKNVVDRIENYPYYYEKAGTYNIAFVAISTGKEGVKKTKVTQMKIVVQD